MSKSIRLEQGDIDDIDKQLKKVTSAVAGKVMLDGMRAAGRKVRDRGKSLAPKGISKSSAKQKKEGKTKEQIVKVPLKTVSAWKVKAFIHENEPVLEVRVKASKKAPHFHLVELGHRLVRGGTVPRIGSRSGTPKAKDPKNTGKGEVVDQVEGRPFLSPAAQQTANEQKRAIKEAALKAIRKALR